MNRADRDQFVHPNPAWNHQHQSDPYRLEEDPNWQDAHGNTGHPPIVGEDKTQQPEREAGTSHAGVVLKKAVVRCIFAQDYDHRAAHLQRFEEREGNGSLSVACAEPDPHSEEREVYSACYRRNENHQHQHGRCDDRCHRSDGSCFPRAVEACIPYPGTRPWEEGDSHEQQKPLKAFRECHHGLERALHSA